MRELQWSREAKAVARAAYDAALAREMASIREEAEAMFRRSADSFGVWEVHDVLSAKRREVDEKLGPTRVDPTMMFQAAERPPIHAHGANAIARSGEPLAP